MGKLFLADPIKHEIPKVRRRLKEHKDEHKPVETQIYVVS